MTSHDHCLCSTASPHLLVACPIFEDELRAVLPPAVYGDVHFMHYDIHSRPARMEQELRAAIDPALLGGRAVKLLVGSECECATPIRDLAAGCRAVIPAEKNCVEIILGTEKARQLQRGRTMLVTPAWVRMVRRAIREERWNDVDARMNMGWFDRMLLLDAGLAPLADEEVLEFFDIVQVPIECMPIGLAHFSRVVAVLLDKGPV